MFLRRRGKTWTTRGNACWKKIYVPPAPKKLPFQAFSRVIREAGKRFVVMDTAPTGHTLLLLDATGAYHREIKKWGIKVILLPQ
jgi:arsenite-transporting ATPase